MVNLPLWTPLASILLALAWLLPNASPPWLAFHKDAWIALVLWGVAAVVVFKPQNKLKVFETDALSCALILMAILTMVQLALGVLYFSGHAAIGFGYFFAAGTAVMVGRAWERGEPGQVGNFLFLAFLLAALCTSGLMLAQWLQWEAYEVWISPLKPNGRPYGNLIQPNNAATLLLLGIVGLFWFGMREKIARPLLTAAAGYLLFFVTLTGSRIGYLSFFSLALLGFLMGWVQPKLRSWRWVFGLLVLLFPACLFLGTHEWSGNTVEMSSVVRPFERNLTTARLLVYVAYTDVALANPWFGLGFEQGAKTNLAAIELGHELPGLFTWSHNAFLDVATWFGIPMLLFIVGAVGAALISIIRTPFSNDRAVYLAGIYVVFAHGMVELPLAYAYFLLPICMMAGAMLADVRIATIKLPSAFVGGALIVLGALLSLVTYDYLKIESAFYTWRFKQANVGRNHPMDVPNTFVLNQFESLLTGLRGSAESLNDAEVRNFEQAVMLNPSAAALQHLAEVQVRRGEAQSAQSTAKFGHAISKPRDRKALAARWRYLGTQDKTLQSVDWPE